MRRSERGESLPASTSTATREPGVSPNARAARRPRGSRVRPGTRDARLLRGRGAGRLVVTMLCFVLTFQPSYALAGNLSAMGSSHNSSPARSLPSSPLHTFATFTGGVLDYVSSLFGSNEAVDKTSPDASSAAVEPAPPAPLPTPTPDAAISRHYPSLNGGRIEGNLRVFSGENIAINSTFQLTGDLYTVGTPNVIVNSGASYGGLIDDGGTSTPSGYPVTLNSGFVMPGKIHKRANALTLPTMPTVPAASGTRTVNINSAADVSTIGSWSTVKDLNVSPGGLTINVPPGNYGTFTLNGTSRLNFVAGTYNFSGTINLNAGSTIQTTGNVTINIAQNFNLNGGFVTGTNTQPGDVIVNIIGTSCSFNNTSSVMGSVRAPNANVNFNGSGVVTGQVIANYLNMNGGKIVGNTSVTPPPDTTPPVVAITAPANNSTTTNTSINVSGTASDPGTNATGIASVTVNNTPATYNAATGQWTVSNISLNVGANTITARAIDNAGNPAVATINVTRNVQDTTPPILTVTEPADGSTTDAEIVNVSGTVADAGANASGVARVTVNGAQATLSPSGSWTLQGLALNVGANAFAVQAFDNAGNETSKTVGVTRRPPADTQLPTLVVSSPANNSSTDAETVSFSGTASDTGAYASGVAHVYVGEREAQLNPQSGAWSLGDVQLIMGQNAIVVRAVDHAGNTAPQTVNVRRIPPPDTVQPNLHISTPTGDSTTQEESVTVSGTASDPGEFPSGVSRVMVNGQPASFDAQTGAWTLAGVALVIGANTIDVRAFDNAGNSTPQSITVNRVPPPDTNAPTVVINTPAEGFISPDETITVTGTAIDEGSYATGVRQVTVNGRPADYNAATHQWTVSGISLAEGANVIRAVAEDNSPAPNRGEAVINVTRHTPDTRPPTIEITSPLTPFETFDETLNVAGTAVDDGLNASGVARVTVNGREAAFDAATGRWSITSIALEYGDNLIAVVATDSAPAANQGHAEIHVTRKRIPPPTLSIVNPQNGAVLAVTSITVAGSVSSMRPEGLTVTVNGEPAAVNGGQFTKTVQLAEGPTTITAVATDSLGQQTQLSASVVRDLTPPAISFASTPALVQPGGSYRIVVDATDNVGVAEVEFKIGGQHVETSTAAPYEFTLNVPATLAAGQTLVFSAVARDLSGSTSVATAQARTTGPGAVSGYVFDDATGYVLKGTAATFGTQNSITDDDGLYSFVSAAPSGLVRLSKEGYTPVERLFSVNPGEGAALFDARLTPLDAHANALDNSGGTATGDGGRLQVRFDAGALGAATNVRVTNVSPQGLANLLPYGWSPAPGAVVDVRPAASGGALILPAHLSVTQTQYLSAGTSVALARYDEAGHGWTVVAVALTAGPNGSLAADLPAFGQYAFLVADQGATAPPPPVVGATLPAGRPADAATLDKATATAVASPRAAAYSADARSTVNFVADAPTQLPSGVAVEASFGETYRFLGGNEPLLVERPAQDFVLYAFPAASGERPNRLGAFFIAKPTRTEFTIAELLGANVHVEIRTGRQPRVGALVGGDGGQVRSGGGGRLTIPAGAVTSARPIYFSDVQPDVANLQLPTGYEIVAGFDIDLSGSSLAHAATISAPVFAGDLSRIVVARVVTVGGQRGPKVVARAVEENGQLVSNVNPPAVPSGVALAGVTVSGRYLFIRIADPFGYAKGSARDGAGGPSASVRVSNDRTPFIDVTGTDGGFVLLGSAGEGAAGVNQLSAASLVTDATGSATATLAAQDAVANADVSLSTTPLAVASVAPAQGAQSVIVTAPVTVTFNKPVASQSITGSSFTLTTAAGNPVLGTTTVLAGSRVVVFTPSNTLAGSTSYRVTLTQAVRDIYGKPLSNVFTSTFTTAGVVRVDARLRPERILIRYPDADGVSRIIIPAGAVPEGSTIVAINNNSGSTASTVAGTQGLELSIQARVGDEITLIVRQPDGVEYRVTQGAYKRDDGVTSVGASGGTLTSDDGQIVLEVPAGAITGQADIQLSARRESDITAPREREMSAELMAFGAGVQLRATGTFTQEKELHLEVNVPAGVSTTEDQRIAFMRPRQLTFGEQQGTAWQTLTSGKVEGGRFKSMSPPFLGIWFDPAWWDIFVFVPRAPMRAVNGIVYQLKTGQPEEPMAGVPCTIADAASTQYPSVFAISNEIGSFSTLQTQVAFSENVSVTCIDSTGRKQYSIASPQLNIDPFKNPGLNGLSTLFATVKFPDDSDAPDRRPAQIELFPKQLKIVNGEPVPLAPDEPNTLIDSGVVRVGTPIRVSVKTTPDIEDQNIKGDLYVGDVKVQSLLFRKISGSTRETDFLASSEGSYSVRIETLTKTGVPTSKATARFDFLSLQNPNTRPPVTGPPTVISVTPADRSTQIDAGSSVHLDFSEPVKNLVPGTTIFIKDLDKGTIHGGKLSSGGVPIGPNTESISSVDFQPDPPLEGGRQYEVNITTGVIDSTNVALAQPFKSTFKTFTGTVLTGTGVADSSYRIASAGQFAVTVYNPGISGSEMKVYDMSNPRTPEVIHQGFIPQRALAVAMVEVETDEPTTPSATPTPTPTPNPNLFHVGVTGESFSRIAVVTTHTLPDIERSCNLWIYSLEDPTEPQIVGVVSLSFPSRTTSIPGQVVIYGKRAYVGTAAQGGLLVVDLEQAMNDWAKAIQQNGPNFTPQHPQTRAVLPNVGFDFEAKVQSAPYGGPPTGNPSPIYAVSVVEQRAQLSNLGETPRRMPVAYVATNKPQLISFGLDSQNDGLNGFFDHNPPGGGNGLDDRVLATTNLSPIGYMVDVRAVAGLQYKGHSTDVAVALGADRLWIFNVTNPNAPTQYPSRTLAELGFGDAGLARRMEVEGTFGYIIFANQVGVIDFSDPERPIRVSTIKNVGDDLRWISVKDGFVYTLSGGTGARAGLNVSIGRPVSQVIVYGVNPVDPDHICANPVVLQRSTDKMAQPAGVYFQIFGHQLTQAAHVIIRKEKTVNGERTVELVTTLSANISPSSSEEVIIGTAQWNDSSRVIERDALYTAEVVLDKGAKTEFKARRESIPFSYLISEYQARLFTRTGPKPEPSPGQPPPPPPPKRGHFGFVLGGAAKLSLTVNGQNIFANPNKPKEPQEPNDPHLRSYGLNIDPVVNTLAEGRYTYVFKATLEGNPSVVEEVQGELTVADTTPTVRAPGSLVINGVNIADGGLLLTNTDVDIKGRGLSLNFTRSYNKATSTSFNPLGYGWTHNFQVLLVQTKDEAGKRVWQMTNGEGAGQTFPETALKDGKIGALDPHQGSLVLNIDGTIDYFTKAHIKFHFPGALDEDSPGFYNSAYMGNLQYIEEPNGNRLTLTYDAKGRMTRVTDSSNRALDFTYVLAETPFVGVMSVSSHNDILCTNRKQFGLVRNRFVRAEVGKAWRISQVKGPGGLELNYEYDDDGNLQKVTHSGSDSLSVATSDSVWEYDYGPPANAQAPANLEHLLMSVKSPDARDTGGLLTSYFYDYQKVGVPVHSISMPEGVTNVFDYTFDSSNRVTQAVVTDARNNKTTYDFDQTGHVKQATGPRGDVTTMTWNSKGQKETEVNAEKRKTTYAYLFDNLASVTIEGEGKKVETNMLWNLTFSKLEGYVDGNKNLTNYTVDPKTGNVRSMKLPNGRTVQYDYYANGDLRQVTDENNLVTTYEYDNYGNPTRISKETSPGSTVITTNTYDARSRLLSTQSTLGPSTTYTYDALDRVVETAATDPAGYRDPLSVTNTYYPGGQLKTQVQTGGGQQLTTVLTYDDLGRLKQRRETLNGGGGSTQSYTYDKNSNLLTETDRRGVTKTYTYDALNFWTSTTISGSFGGGSTVIADARGAGDIDMVGNPRHVKDQYGQTVTLDYDGLHRLTVRHLPNDATEVFDYDANNNIISAQDRKKRKVITTFDEFNRPATQKDAAGRMTTWAYDDDTRTVTVEQAPVGLVRVKQTDSLGRPLRDEVKFDAADYVTTYKYSGRSVEIKDPLGVVTNQTLSAFGDVGEETVLGASPAWNVRHDYTAFGGPKSFRDANGRTTTYTTDSLNRVTSVSYPGGFGESFTYDGGGYLLTHLDRRGALTTMTYDNLGRPLTTQIRDGAQTITAATRAYDDEARTETVTDARQHSSVYKYDLIRRLESVTNADHKVMTYAYDDEQNTLDQTDFKNQHTKLKYDKLDRLIELTDRDSKVVTYDLVENNGLTKTVTDRRGNKRVEKYDALGRLKSVTVGDEPLVSYEYDGNGNRKVERDGRGNRVDYTYDALNRVKEINRSSVRVETFDYDAAGNVTRYADGAGGPVTMTYDQLDHLQTRTDGEGNTTRFKFDGGGLLLEKTEPKGNDHRTTYEYNAFGSLKKVTDPRSGEWAIEYFPDQTLKSVTDALGRRVDYEYDTLKRLSTVTQHDGSASFVTTYGYDANGNRNFTRDPKGQETNVTFDSLDRARAIDYNGATGDGPRRLTYDYDPEGNLTFVNETALTGTHSYARTYDKRGRLKTATDPYSHTVAYDYDAADNVTSVTDAANKQTVYHYDSLNRLNRADLGGGGSVTYTLRADGRPSKATYSSGTERNFTYDAANRLTGVINSLGSQQSEEFDYEYDENSNRVGETRKFAGAAFRSVDYDYDGLDRMTRAAYTDENVHGLKGDYYNNEDFTELKLSRIDPTVNFDWPDAGQASPDPQLDGNTFSVRWTGQIKPLYSESYKFSMVTDEGVRLWVDGKLLIDHWESHEATEHNGSVTLKAGKKYEIKIEFREGTGDAAAKLQWESNHQTKQVVPQSQLYPPAKALDYTYDAVGNRKTEKGRDINDQPVDHSYDYDDLNRLTTAKGYQGGDVSYGYDANGNLLTVTQNSNVTARYEYDARDQLRRVLGAGNAEVARYDYDFERRRLSKTLTGSTAQRYVYDEQNVLDEYSESGALTSHYDYGNELVRADLPNEGERWYFSDGLGSVTALSGTVNGTQAATARYEYGAWGQLIGAAGPSVNPYLFTGQRSDAETGLMPMGAGERYYLPGLGRFIQQDSWSGQPGMGQSLNRYAYGYSNPLRYTDPSGHAPVPVEEPGVFEQTAKGVGKAAWNIVTEPVLWVYDTATVVEARILGIDSEDFRLKSALGSSQQQAIEAGVPPSKVAASGIGGIVYGTVTLGLGPLTESVGGDILALQDGRITLSEYNERMGESLGNAIAIYAMTKAAGGGKASPRTLGESVRTGMSKQGPLRSGLSRMGEGLRAFGREVGERTRRFGREVKAAWEESAGVEEPSGQLVTPDGQVMGGGPRLPDLARPVRAVKNFFESRSNKPLLSGGRGTPTQGAVELQARAWELNRLRTKGQAEYGTTAAIKVRHIKSRKIEVRIATNVPDAVIPEWEGMLRPGERYISGTGHAESTIIKSLGSEWEIIEGGTSRNICGLQCAPLIEDLGLEIGGPRFRKMDPTYTDYRMFWRKE